MELKIKTSAECRYDLISLGECMIRLSPPGHQRIEMSPYFEVYAGGAEYNVAYALSRYGLRTGWVSRLVDNQLGHFIRNHAMASGMDISKVIWVPFDGVGRKERIGLNFTEVGVGVRPSVAVYDRGNTAVSGMQASEIDWKRIFMDEKVRVFHTGGTFSALSDSCVEVVKGSLKESKKNGTLVSYDLNYRSKLWPSDKAIKITGEIAPFIDIVFGNEEDFQKALGFEVDGLDENLKTLPLDSYKKMAEKVVKKYPNIRIVATTLREVKNGSVNNWSAVAYFNGKYYESRKYENIIIEDRVGGGDGFCSGFIYGLLKGMALEDCVEIGAAHGALLQTTRGDTSMVTMDETMYLAKNGSSRIRR